MPQIEILHAAFHWGQSRPVSAPTAARIISDFCGWDATFPTRCRLIVALWEWNDRNFVKSLLRRHFLSVTIERFTDQVWELDNGTAIRFLVPNAHSFRGYNPDVLWIAGGLRGGGGLGSGPDLYRQAMQSVRPQEDNRTLVVESERP